MGLGGPHSLPVPSGLWGPRGPFVLMALPDTPASPSSLTLSATSKQSWDQRALALSHEVTHSHGARRTLGPEPSWEATRGREVLPPRDPDLDGLLVQGGRAPRTHSYPSLRVQGESSVLAQRLSVCLSGEQQAQRALPSQRQDRIPGGSPGGSERRCLQKRPRPSLPANVCGGRSAQALAVAV